MSTPVPQKINELIENGYQFKFGDYISEGFELFQKNAGQFILFTLVFFLIAMAASFIPFASLVITGPLTAGYYIVSRKVQKGEATEFGDFFKGFDQIGPLILVHLIGQILIMLGLVCLIIPGIYLAVGYTFAMFFVIFYNLGFWEALETSRKLVTKNWFSIFAFVIVLALINVVGVLLLGVGLLATVPISACATYVAFADITRLEEEDNDIIDHLIA